MFAKKKATVQIKVIVIMVQTRVRNKALRTPKILTDLIVSLFILIFVGCIYLLYRRSTDNFVRPKVNVEVIKDA